MAKSLAPVLKQRFFDANGNPLAGGKLYSYQAGTTTPQDTYTDSTGNTPNTNPVILDADGYADVWLDQSLSYKLVLTDANDVQQLVTDNIIGLTTVDSVATESIQDNAVTTAKIADGAVTGDKIKSSALIDGDRPITSDHIRNSAVTRAKMATGAVAPLATVTKSAAYTVTGDDDLILGDASSAGFTLTLPAASASAGKAYRFKKIDSSANAVTIAGAGADTIDGVTSITLTVRYEAISLICDGTKWNIF